MPHHLTADGPHDAVLAPLVELLRGRSMCCGARAVSIEGVVRGYLSGSGWKDYSQPAGLRRRAAGRPARERSSTQPIFTPATKAESGHDENICEAQAAAIVGEADLARPRR